MAELLDTHECESCSNYKYHMRLAEPQPCRRTDVSAEDAYVYADWVIIDLINVTHPDTGEKYHEVSVWASDEDAEEYEALIYMYNRPRTLDEVTWILGGEYVAEGKDTNGSA